MSLNNVKLVAITTTLIGPDSIPFFRTLYTLTTPIGGHDSGGIETPVEGLTETTFNLQMAQAVADRANLESSNLEQFIPSDVIGGRI